uniref:KAT8 regulatory NSL complex subunit 1-like n=1 Tax=Sinocyclocheilus rhinocerous TaxID=307959 RepID=A0A673M9H0_9TELE
MAAMAPALTDTPAEARHIRFKLASPSSTLSPGSTENNSNASNILISDSGQEQEPLSNAPSLGKLATYLCSDVKPLPSSTKVKESLKLQGVLIKQSVLKSHGLLSGSIFPSAAAGSDFLLRKRHTLELTRGQLKSLVNGAGAGSTMVPVNGLSKKVAVPSAAVAEKGSVATVNGDSNQPSTNGEALLSVSSKSVGTFATGDVKPQQNLTPSVQGVSSHRELTALSESMEVKAEPESPVVETNSNNIVDCPLSRNSSPVHDDSSLSTPNLEALLRDRAQQSQHRQTDIEGRLLRLRKRLQVVQAKQVQRHFKQQLTGFLDRTLTPTSSRRADQGAWRGTRASVDTHAHNLSQFLKGGRVASELEQLHLSGTTYLRATEAQFDSDATESSSGGESDIEEEELGRADVEQQLQRVCVYIYIYIYIYIHIHYIYYFSSVAEVSDTCLSSLDSSCTSARTRPLLTCRRRRLIHPNTVHNLNGKVRLVSFSPPSVCEVNGSCIMCGSTPPLSKPDLPFNRPLLERVAHQDRSIHPVLSMQSDVALSLQLKKVLRSHWQTRPFDRIKSLKKISLKHKLSITPASSFLSKHKFRLSNSHAAAVLVMDACPSPCASLSSLHSSNTSPLTRQLSLPVESSTPLGNSVVRSLFSPVRRRRGESPFDINNIVIPMSVAATTRVEKLQYKEILTPRWREVDILAKPLVEDLSEGAFAKLHQTLEDQERSRWRWTALAPAKRRGSRYLSYKSLDGRTTPSIVGTNPSTPQPSSPDASHFHLLQDYGPVPSPLSPPSPDTPCSRDAHTPHTRDAHRLLYSEDTCGSTSDCTFEEMVTYTHSHASFMIIILLVFSIEKNFN